MVDGQASAGASDSTGIDFAAVCGNWNWNDRPNCGNRIRNSASGSRGDESARAKG
jgi:hypothetical protein